MCTCSDSIVGLFCPIHVTEGMDVVDKIAETDTDYRDKPIVPKVMKKVTVETFGVDYPEPEKM